MVERWFRSRMRDGDAMFNIDLGLTSTYIVAKIKI